MSHEILIQSDLITLLRNYLDVTKLRNISAAAKVNSITQSAMTKRMKRLCLILGVSKLYYFEKKEMILTGDGDKLRESAIKVITSFDQLLTMFKVTNGLDNAKIETLPKQEKDYRGVYDLLNEWKKEN